MLVGVVLWRGVVIFVWVWILLVVCGFFCGGGSVLLFLGGWVGCCWQGSGGFCVGWVCLFAGHGVLLGMCGWLGWLLWAWVCDGVSAEGCDDICAKGVSCVGVEV